MFQIYKFTGLTPEEFARRVKGCTAPAVAKEYGISKQCAWNWMRGLGVSAPPRRPKSNPLSLKPNAEPGAAAAFFRAHAGEKLPYKERELAEMAGLSHAAVHSYLARRRVRILVYLRALGDLRNLPKTLIATNGLHIPASRIREYTLRVDPRAARVEVRALLTATIKVTIDLSLREYAALFGVAEQPALAALQRHLK
jgi:hypothetical protein